MSEKEQAPTGEIAEEDVEDLEATEADEVAGGLVSNSQFGKMGDVRKNAGGSL